MVRFRRMIRRTRVRLGATAPGRWVLYALGVAALALILIAVLVWHAPLGGTLSLRPGEVAPFDVVSPQQLTYVSAILTDQARERAANAVPEQFDSASGSTRRDEIIRARRWMAEIGALRSDASSSEDERLAGLLAIEELGLSAETAILVLNLSDDDWAHAAADVPLALDRVLRNEIRPDMLATVRRGVPTTISADLSEQASEVATDLVQALVRPNSFPNPDRTEEMREAAREDVTPVSVSVARGETILRAGDVATPLDVEALGQIGFLDSDGDAWALLRSLAFAVALLATTIGAFVITRGQQPIRGRQVMIVLLLSAAWLILARFMIIPHDWLAYLYPLAALSMLIACLVNVRAALVVTAAFALVVLYLSESNTLLASYMLCGGWAGALVLGRAERISSFLWAALAVFVSNVLTTLAYRVPFEGMSNPQLLQLLFVLLLNGGLSSSIALLGYFGLGALFGITTSLQLNELSRPTHPLLRQLLLKATGTYHHTIVVSNLAERGAAAIGADALLARVGAYYHDIGKTVRPYFFTENINDDASPHDKLDPLTSAQVIISHVRDGLDLAQKYRLPGPIQDFIREHHGRSLVQYFYIRAVRAAAEGETVDPEQFRYPGPRPRTKETAILALADTCEAAVRAMRPGTREDLALLVNRLVDERAAEGELDECPLTFRDLQAIRTVFVQVLLGVHHPRITYPEPQREGTSALPVPGPVTGPASGPVIGHAALPGAVSAPAPVNTQVTAGIAGSEVGSTVGTGTGTGTVAGPALGANGRRVGNGESSEGSAEAASAGSNGGVEEVDESPAMISVDKAG